jgi:membrane protein implicated in regulation of membrane protease activity
MFFYGYLFVGFLGLVALIVGVSQWAVGKPPWFLWGLAAAAIGTISLYVVAQIGQKLGASQTFRLHQAYEEAIGEQAEIR